MSAGPNRRTRAAILHLGAHRPMVGAASASTP